MTTYSITLTDPFLVTWISHQDDPEFALYSAIHAFDLLTTIKAILRNHEDDPLTAMATLAEFLRPARAGDVEITGTADIVSAGLNECTEMVREISEGL